MVRAIKGTLVECDASVKQILIAMHKNAPFIIEELDETHLLIDSGQASKLKERLEELLEDHTYRILPDR